MKKLLFAFIILFLAIGLGFLIHENSGYVMIVYRHWVITTNFWVATLTTLITFIALYFIIRLLKNIIALPKKITQNASLNRAQKKQIFFLTALSDLLQGNYLDAEKKCLRAISKNTPNHIYYITAAFAAQSRHDIKRRDKFLSRAYQCAKKDKDIVVLANADLHYQSGDYQDVINLLSTSPKLNSKNVKALSLLLDANEKLKNWSNILALLPSLSKHNIKDKGYISTLERKCHVQLLQQSLDENDSQKFQTIWENTPKSLKTSPEIAAIYLSYCQSFQTPEVAQRFIESILKKQWEPTLLLSYVDSRNHDKTNLLEKLKTAEHWLKKQGDDPTLLTILSILSIKTQFIAKASSYADKAFQCSPDHKTRVLLASAYEQLGNKDKALLCYKL